MIVGRASRREHRSANQGPEPNAEGGPCGAGVRWHAGRARRGQAALRPRDFTLVGLSQPCRHRHSAGDGFVTLAFPKALLTLRHH